MFLILLGSPQQVNIPESISLKLQARYQFGDIDVFDEARVHVWSLLSQESYSRFAQIPEFTPTYLSVCSMSEKGEL